MKVKIKIKQKKQKHAEIFFVFLEKFETVKVKIVLQHNNIIVLKSENHTKSHELFTYLTYLNKQYVRSKLVVEITV